MSTRVWSSNVIRNEFLTFFKEKQHQIVPSAPLVLKNDPTLMFTNAGMNQFKNYFLNYKQPPYARVADTQKCLRVSGKHNDLEDVGFDTYHHTFFEMLGNWSFGDYFKKEAIAWAWELLTKVFQIPEDRLYVTIFEGDEADGVPRDQEAFDCWKEWIDEDRIINGNKKDNFWEMGDTGPCGPCSEIHIDLRSNEERNNDDAKKLINQDHPQVIEVWNLVFMQFNRMADGRLQALEKNHIDTGMGFERLCMALQGKSSTYDTDLFRPLIEHIEKISQTKYHGGQTMTDVAIRVIVDHIRAISFSIADGQLPSNSGAGYVIRRILRRAVRYGYSFLNLKNPFLYELVPALVQKMGEAFDELSQQEQLIQNVIREEENSFLRTLESGLKKMETFTEDIDGQQAFELYDTYGFPFDLTKLIASEKQLNVDEAGFNEAMAEQKKRSQKDAQMEVGDWTIISDQETHFIGYDEVEANVAITRYRNVIKKQKEIIQLVFDQTPFYAESGGQVGDSGVVQFPNETIAIYDVKKENNLIVHYANALPEKLDEKGRAIVNYERRRAIEKNHSATHLLHAALRQVLGDHVEQKGSLVNEEKLRFDFSHFAKLSEDELHDVEQMVNKKIADNVSRHEQRNIPFEEAVNQGATALFGEKYDDNVRVISFDPDYSIELCGGNHVLSTAEIQVFKIMSESAISSGIRRIEAITGLEAIHYFQQQEQQLKEIREEVPGDKDVVKAVQKLSATNKALENKLNALNQQQAQYVKQELIQSVDTINGIHFITGVVDLPDAEYLKNIAFELRNEIDNLILILGTNIDGKPLLTIMISDDLVNKYHLNAGQLIREIAKNIKGGGGGQPFYATAGGKDLSGLQNAVEQGKTLVLDQVNK